MVGVQQGMQQGVEQSIERGIERARLEGAAQAELEHLADRVLDVTS